jgi:hypothetical protein
LEFLYLPSSNFSLPLRLQDVERSAKYCRLTGDYLFDGESTSELASWSRSDWFEVKLAVGISSLDYSLSRPASSIHSLSTTGNI